MIFSFCALLSLVGLTLLLIRDLYGNTRRDPLDLPLQTQFHEEKLSNMERELLAFFRELPEKTDRFFSGANPFFTTYFEPPPLPDPPVASFGLDPQEGVAPLTVDFTDESTGEIDVWSWDFGNEEAVADASPSYTFDSEGEYTVRLTVSGAGGESSTEALLRVSAPPPPPPEPDPPRQVTLVYRGFYINSAGEEKAYLLVDDGGITVVEVGAAIEDEWRIKDFDRVRMLLMDGAGEIVELSFNREKTLEIPDVTEEEGETHSARR